MESVLTWSCKPRGDGIDWELREGAGQYDLTVSQLKVIGGICRKLFAFCLQIEQLKQKEEKRDRTRDYKIIKDYAGWWFPVLSFGLRVACRPPCTDEPRIRLKPGDRVKVTRWKK